MIASRVFIRALRTAAFVTGWSMSAALAGSMTTDPKGFNGISWGSSLEGRPDLVTVYSSPRIKEYELKTGPVPLGEAKVEHMRFSTVDNQFARVAVRFSGTRVLEQLVAYLQGQYGLLNLTPGQITRGQNLQFTWRGQDTEIHLTFDGRKDRGNLFIESSLLAPRFNDTIPGDSY